MPSMPAEAFAGELPLEFCCILTKKHQLFKVKRKSFALQAFRLGPQGFHATSLGVPGDFRSDESQ